MSRARGYNARAWNFDTQDMGRVYIENPLPHIMVKCADAGKPCASRGNSARWPMIFSVSLGAENSIDQLFTVATTITRLNVSDVITVLNVH